MMREADDHPLHSIPYHLKMDNGAFSRAAETTNLLDALGVEVERKNPDNQNALGKIERTWRVLWQNFEARLFMKHKFGYRLYLEDLNELLYQYLLEEIEGVHFGEKKRVIYERDCQAYPRRRFDGDPYVLASRPHRRKVSTDLMFQFQKEFYEAPERYYNKWVLLHINAAGEIIGEGEEDGIRFAIKEFEFRESGEYRRFEDTYSDKIIKKIRAEETHGGTSVLPMKGKTKTIEAESPFVETHGDASVLSRDKAKEYIFYQLGDVDSYADVAHLFDDSLKDENEIETLDQVINLVRKMTG